jgi:transposase
MDREIASRLRWVLMYHETGNAGLVCARCGISRPTLRKWLRRYRDAGEEGLRSQSRRPLNSPNRKVSEADRARILQLRAERKGARRIQNELRLHEQRELSLATIHKVLTKASVKPLVRSRRPANPKRYSRPVPGDRVQMDTMKIARGVYQYTAIDDCSRFRWLSTRAETPEIRCFFLIVSSKRCHFQSSVSRPTGVASSSPNRCSGV